MAGTRKTATQRLVTPLVIISLFVTLTEVVIGVAATKTVGHIQEMFGIFSIVFAVVVASAFFGTLWFRPWVLYHPGEYGGQDVGRYVEAMKHRPIEDTNLDSKIQHSLRTVFTDEVLTALKALPGSSELRTELRSVVEKAADHAVADIRKSSFLTFDFKLMAGSDSREWVAPYESFSTVTEMLDTLWSRRLHRNVPAYTYGEKWVLCDSKSKKRFTDIGYEYASKALGDVFDRRSLSEVGILPGMTLEAIRI
jgi:hypothetical protein